LWAIIDGLRFNGIAEDTEADTSKTTSQTSTRATDQQPMHLSCIQYKSVFRNTASQDTEAFAKMPTQIHIKHEHFISITHTSKDIRISQPISIVAVHNQL
jgi:hypothetical protein